MRKNRKDKRNKGGAVAAVYNNLADMFAVANALPKAIE
jgi:hypothetical protein